MASAVENTSQKPLEMCSFKILNFKMSLDALAHKNLCLWCEFQSCILFVISLLLLMFLTALLSIDNITLLGEN